MINRTLEKVLFSKYLAEQGENTSDFFARLLSVAYVSLVLLLNINTVILLAESITSNAWVIDFADMLYSPETAQRNQILMFVVVVSVLFFMKGRESCFRVIVEKFASESEEKIKGTFLTYLIVSAFIFLFSTLLTLITNL